MTASAHHASMVISHGLKKKIKPVTSEQSTKTVRPTISRAISAKPAHPPSNLTQMEPAPKTLNATTGTIATQVQEPRAALVATKPVIKETIMMTTISLPASHLVMKATYPTARPTSRTKKVEFPK